MNKINHNYLMTQGTDCKSGADFGIVPNSVQTDLTSSSIEIVVFNYT
ncbi:hypothetical protein HQ571_06850 [Candidatus Kuenenbacteria bacterium]|nr:hypothetical protein [Candidatus Kuenenbacteria bacterium]